MPTGFEAIAKATGKAIETVPEVYDDGLKQATQESGKLLAIIPQTISAALLPLRKWNIEREYNFKETEKLLAQKLEQVSPDKIVTPKTYVAVPAIHAISYSMDSDELRNLYANLLAKSMNIDTKNAVHPAYIEIIKQLSPTDAQVFNEISNTFAFACADLSVAEYSHDISNEDSTFINPLESALKRYSFNNVTSIAFASYDSVQLSIDNLLRLKLIEEKYAIGKELPDTITSTDQYAHFKSILETYIVNTHWAYEEVCTSLELSSLGRNFKKICVDSI